MKKIIRDKDVISGNKDLEHLYTFKNFPVFMGCTDEPESNDVFSDMAWHISKGSGIIQLNPLLPLDVVYVTEHGSGTVGKSWDNHHQSFAEFISKYNIESVLEIGGLHGILAKKTQEIKEIDWTIIEPNPIIHKDIKIKVIQGFFDEEFTSEDEYDTIVHSHVLEHIYEPDKFLSHISKFIKKGGKLMFSVPNMDVMIHNKYTNCVNFEHTILLGERFIEHLLSKHGFELVDKEYYKDDHSIFYCVEKKSLVNITELPKETYNEYTKLFNEYIQHHLNDVELINNTIRDNDTPVYLFGAHVFSQYLISFGLETDKIVGLLDNDTSKVGKRLYGTNLTSQTPKILKDIPEAIVILRAGVYNDEIKEDILNNVNINIKFI